MNKGVIFLAIAAGLLLFKKGSAASSPGGSADLEHKIFQQLSTILEADPVFLSGAGFPSNFYDYVQADLQAINAGSARDPLYAHGLPGAFMSVADAWMGAMGYSDATHGQLWNLYNSYLTTLSKQNL